MAQKFIHHFEKLPLQASKSCEQQQQKKTVGSYTAFEQNNNSKKKQSEKDRFRIGKFMHPVGARSPQHEKKHTDTPTLRGTTVFHGVRNRLIKSCAHKFMYAMQRPRGGRPTTDDEAKSTRSRKEVAAVDRKQSDEKRLPLWP